MHKPSQIVKVYPVFKHVWTDSDDGVREYEMIEVFKSTEEASAFIKVYYSIKKPHWFQGTLEIEPLLLTKGVSPYHLQWRDKDNCWIASNSHSFKVAKPKAVLYFLKKYKPEELSRVYIDGCKPYSLM